ncbi:MAG: FixH family protein [Phycisphaerales bacterium]
MKIPSKVIWPGMVFLLIGANICIVGVTVIAANTEKSFAFTEPDYYASAVKWDETARAIEASRNSGWTVDTHVTSAHTRLCVKDENNAPVTNARVMVEYFSLLDPSDRSQFESNTDHNGQFTIGGPFQNGAHEFRIRINTPELNFVRSIRASNGE